EQRRGLRLAMRDERAQTNGAVPGFDPPEPLDVAQAHEAARVNQALPHHGDERGAARDDAAVVPVLLEDGERFVDGPWRAIVEGIHDRACCAAVRIDST